MESFCRRSLDDGGSCEVDRIALEALSSTRLDRLWWSRCLPSAGDWRLSSVVRGCRSLSSIVRGCASERRRRVRKSRRKVLGAEDTDRT